MHFIVRHSNFKETTKKKKRKKPSVVENYQRFINIGILLYKCNFIYIRRYHVSFIIRLIDIIEYFEF